MAGEDDRLIQLLSHTPAAIVQFTDIEDDVAVILTTLDSVGKLHTKSRSLGIDSKSLRSIKSSLRLILRCSSPLATKIDLQRVREWDRLVSLLITCVSDLPAGLPLLIVAGPVGEATISIALGCRPLCFVPSVAALVALRERRFDRFSGLHWSLKRWFDFSVWFDRELPSEAEALANIVVQGSELAGSHKMAHEGVSGKNATERRLLQGLEDADLARIACHGRFVPEAESIDLLVAAKGFLPPSNLMEINDANIHIVSWQRLAALGRAPIAVFSSACDSGVAAINPSGERLGLERPLFTAGTLLYVAPLWPVPTVDIQKLAARLIDSWLGDQNRSLAVHLAELRVNAAAEGIPQLATAALAVFGDGI